MFIIVIVTLNVLLFAYILFYGLCLFSLPFIGAHKRKTTPTAETTESDTGEVSILIPSHYEGEGLVSTLRSIIEQDYQGPIRAFVLIRDTEDSAFPHLKKYFGFDWKKKDTRKVIFSDSNRKIELVCSGVAPKREKLNEILPTLKTDYIAFLDADHRAEPTWISDSVHTLCATDYAGVQSRRAPLSLEKLPQLWDSAQNHIGNELVNRALDKTVGAVFFTGTTCVFRAKSIEGMLFGDSVTEDTFFSYELLSQQKFITYNSNIGSREEVAPDVRSYLARRRRWSCGHNKTFFTVGPKILRADVPLRNKLATLIHGLFYTVPVAVCLLLTIFALHFFVQYTLAIRVLIVLFSAASSLLIAHLLFGWHRNIAREAFAVFAIMLPQATILAPIILYLIKHELFFFLTAFPYAYYIFWSQGFCLYAPLLLLLIGSRQIKILRFSQLLTLVVSYPIFFLLDLYACVLGFIDYVFGKPTWSKINRTYQESALLEGDSVTARKRIIRWGVSATALALLVVGVNDFTAYPNCGKPEYYLFQPVFYRPTPSVNWDLQEYRSVHPSAPDDERLKVDFISTVNSNIRGPLVMHHYVDEKFLYTSKGTLGLAADYELIFGDTSYTYFAGTYRYITENLRPKPLGKEKEFVSEYEAIFDDAIYPYLAGTYRYVAEAFQQRPIDQVEARFSYLAPLGWESHDYIAKMRFEEEFCERERGFTTTFRELREKQLYVNGEPFLIKGVIPSFTPRQRDIPLALGMKQIKELGANVVRYYHAALKSHRREAKKNHLLIIDQPDRSTWDDVNLLLPWQRSLLHGRFLELIRENRNNPFTLFHTLGNELEIRNPALALPRLHDLMVNLSKDIPYDFFAYSTFFVYLKLPAAIYGINMLDSGQTYWQRGLETIQLVDKPFYASEFGGFVAAYERTPEDLRAWRLFDYWQRIADAGGMGLVIHQSHDNWSQPLVDGFNDPFTPDQPDDERGIWNTKNEPKDLKRFVEQLFADIAVHTPPRALPPSSESYTLALKNIRPYHLRDIRLYRGEEQLLPEAFDIAPHQFHEVTLKREAQELPEQRITARYTTHGGLEVVSQLHYVVPLQFADPLVLNTDVLQVEAGMNSIRGQLLRSETLRLVLPSEWSRVEHNKTTYTPENSIVEIPLQPSIRESTVLERSQDAITWEPVEADTIGDGPQRLRFKLPAGTPSDATLILAGLGTRQFHIRWGEDGQWQEQTSHFYRENLFKLAEMGINPHEGKYFYLLIPRTLTEFINAQVHPTGKQVKIAFEMPKIFAPSRFEVIKSDETL